MNDKQPKALRLANALEKDLAVTWGDVEKAAEELRRLHEENQALRQRSCPPCNQDCDQGRRCPSR